MSKKVTIAMSGGVDSTVAALLLKDQSYQVTGLTLSLYKNDLDKAREAAKIMGIPHRVLDYQEIFYEEVMKAFKESYEKGDTPNPCIVCNEKVKFGRLFLDGEIHGDGYLATGHYAIIEYNEETGRYLLKKAKDRSKDQSYFLYRLSQEVLARTLFPLGNLTKDEIRQIAFDKGLSDGKKSDSQDICFISGEDYGHFLEASMGTVSKPGDFVDSKGQVLGKHKGIIHYTPGQRRGLNISFDKRKYVVEIDPLCNQVVLGDEEDLYKSSLIVDKVNLISLPVLQEAMEVEVKTRYSHKGALATISPLEEGQDQGKGKIRVDFKEAQRAISPGQSAVFYREDEVIGGGIIL